MSQVASEAQGQASQVAGETRAQASQVASQAQRQAAEVAGEAKRQARDLVGETRGQISQQASDQQKRAASSVRQLADGLSRMAEQAPAEAGLAAELAHRAADTLHTVGGHLDSREPGELLDDVRSFARQRPGVFLTAALVGGFVTGRLVKSATARPSAADHRGEASAATSDRTPIDELPAPAGSFAAPGSGGGAFTVADRPDPLVAVDAVAEPVPVHGPNAANGLAAGDRS
ncbi:hypothetical protein FraQA3DRAFT_1043 [Frankia sp. QA3]|nr:hypothetical protein FraQA3DRAFT_1043 [Frankia sp. QA3]